MNELIKTTQKFENDLFQLEVKTEKGESLFDVETVARSLGIVQTKNGKEYIRWERINEYLFPTCGERVTKGSFISEPMVYKLAFKANNDLAEKFQDWLAIEVLPQIRKHGMYAADELLDNPDLLIEVATRLKEERTKRLIAEAKVAEYEPKADYVDKILKCQGTMATTQVAFDYGMSAQRFNKLLHELGIQYKVNGQWILYTKHQRKGYVKTKTFEHNGKAYLSTHWTQKGRLFLYEELKKEGHYPNEHLEVDTDE